MRRLTSALYGHKHDSTLLVQAGLINYVSCAGLFMSALGQKRTSG